MVWVTPSGQGEEMKFINRLSSRASLRKKKYFEFDDIPESIIKKGRKHTYENPLCYVSVYPHRNVYLLYETNRKLQIEFRHSFNSFEELLSLQGEKP